MMNEGAFCTKAVNAGYKCAAPGKIGEIDEIDDDGIYEDEIDGDEVNENETDENEINENEIFENQVDEDKIGGTEVMNVKLLENKFIEPLRVMK